MPDKFILLAENVWVAPQIAAEDLAAAKALGVALVINNRPDGEEPFQPRASDIENAARAAGMACVNIPVTNAASISDEDIESFTRAAEAAKGGILAFCRSGTRSTVLRALALASAGADAATLITEAAAAGYDLRGLRPRLEALAARSALGGSDAQ